MYETALREEQQMVQSEIRVRYQETDQMSVVYYGNYFTWFEIGRTDYIRQAGFPYRRLEQQGILIPVVEVQCRYIAPARYDDELIIETTLEELASSKIVFSYVVRRKEDQALLATGMSKHLFTDHQMKRMNLKRRLPEVYDRLQKGG